MPNTYVIPRPTTYDVIFRKWIIEYKDARHTFKQVNEAFGVDSRRYYMGRNSLRKPIPLNTGRQRNAGEK
jgi:hypothetical protein